MTKKSGRVYFANRYKNGKKTEYVGSTTRSVSTRMKEHKKEQTKPKSKTYMGKGDGMSYKGSFPSKNCRKAEKTIKEKKKKAYLKRKYY